MLTRGQRLFAKWHDPGMSASLLRGLRILEMLAREALGVSELARRLEVDKAGVSRVLTALREEGWVLRTGSRYVLGERALHLGEWQDPTTVAVAGHLVRRLAEQSGLTAVAVCLAGTGAQPLAMQEGPGGPELTGALDRIDHLALTAAGIVLLAQLPDPAVRDVLGSDHWPARAGGAPADIDEALAHVGRARDAGLAWEDGWTAPGVCCVAAVWSVPGMTVPHALTLVGRRDRVEGRRAELERLLRGAARAGHTRGG